MNNDAPTFTDPKTISKVVMVSIGGLVLTEVLKAFFIVGYWLDPMPRFNVSENAVVSFWLLLYDLSGMVRSPLFWISAVSFFIWTYRTVKNAPALGVLAPEFSPAWAIICWFIPIVSFFLPYKVVKGIWIDSEPLEESSIFASPTAVTSMIGFWWLFWIVYILGSWIAARLLDSAQSVTGEFVVMSLISSLAGGLSGILIITIIKQIAARQVSRYESTVKEEPVFHAPPAPPTFG